MNTHVMLPDSIEYLFVLFGIIAVAIYIDAAISDIKAARQNKKIREFKENVKASKVSKALADNYTAAAYGDPDDFGYWEETAKQFREG